MTKETGTLAELNVQPGDMVEMVSEKTFHTVKKAERITSGAYSGQIDAELSGFGGGIFDDEVFRLISRASDTPKTWGEMTDAEKGELLLSHHEGKVIEWFHPNNPEWDVCPDDRCLWDNGFAYRIKPEPKRETVTLWWEPSCVAGRLYYDDATHRITFDTLNGEPVLDSIRMEKIGGKSR